MTVCLLLFFCCVCIHFIMFWMWKINPMLKLKVISCRELYQAGILATQKLTVIHKTAHCYLIRLVNNSGEIRIFIHHLILFYCFHNRKDIQFSPNNNISIFFMNKSVKASTT